MGQTPTQIVFFVLSSNFMQCTITPRVVVCIPVVVVVVVHNIIQHTIVHTYIHHAHTTRKWYAYGYLSFSPTHDNPQRRIRVGKSRPGGRETGDGRREVAACWLCTLEYTRTRVLRSTCSTKTTMHITSVSSIIILWILASI